MIGTANQVDRAERIRKQVGTDSIAWRERSSQRLANRRAKANGLSGWIAILEDKRDEVIANDDAGYFIREWHELRDQVQQMVTQDSRYQAIRAIGRRDDVESAWPFPSERRRRSTVAGTHPPTR